MEAENRTQIEKWYHKFPNWPALPVIEEREFEYLGVGAIMIDPRIITGGRDDGRREKYVRE